MYQKDLHLDFYDTSEHFVLNYVINFTTWCIKNILLLLQINGSLGKAHVCSGSQLL